VGAQKSVGTSAERWANGVTTVTRGLTGFASALGTAATCSDACTTGAACPTALRLAPSDPARRGVGPGWSDRSFGRRTLHPTGQKPHPEGRYTTREPGPSGERGTAAEGYAEGWRRPRLVGDFGRWWFEGRRPEFRRSPPRKKAIAHCRTPRRPAIRHRRPSQDDSGRDQPRAIASREASHTRCLRNGCRLSTVPFVGHAIMKEI